MPSPRSDRSDLDDMLVGAYNIACIAVREHDLPLAVQCFALADAISEATTPDYRTTHRDRALDAIIADVDDGTSRLWDWRRARKDTLAWLRTAPIADVRRGLTLVGAITEPATTLKAAS